MKTVSLRKILEGAWSLEAKGDRCTLLGIGPMSERCLRCTLELAKEHRFPPMFIASRNQIDTGGGYVKGWDQKALVDKILSLSQEVGFEGPVYICRDHGGPWQKDEERMAKLPVEEAMAKARASFKADMAAGFNVLHVDPTKDPHAGSPSMETVIERTLQLMRWIDEDRKSLGLGPIGFEIGTEETKGGLIDDEAFGRFLQTLQDKLSQESLPPPDLIVGQTGTLVKVDKNVGHFSPETARKLPAVAKKHNTGFKEHNSDYLSDQDLAMHPDLGITSANVAPEFGVEETRGYLALAKAAIPEAKKFRDVLVAETIQSGKWKKWLPPGRDNLSEADLRADAALFNLSVEVTGHYVFDHPAVTEARQAMVSALKKAGTQDPEKQVDDRVKASIFRYVKLFRLIGFLDKIGV